MARPKALTPDQKAQNIRIALGRAQDQTTKPRFQAPALMPGVVPQGHTAAIAMDSCAATYQYASESMPADFKPFPGYPYLANLSTRTEYRAFAATMSSELFREWISFSGANTGTPDAVQDEERIGQLEDAIRRHNLQGVFRLAAEHDCLFGRAQIMPKIKNANPELPLILSPKTVKMGSLEGFATVEAIWTTPSAYNANDPTAADFYKPKEWWMLGERVHASRMLTIITRQLPDILKPAYNFGGMSLSQLAEPYVNNWLRTRQAISDLINNFSITGLKTNMAQTLQGDCDGADVFARADLFTLTRSNRGLMLLDMEGEELVQVNTPLTGLHELQAQSQEHMCSATRIPAMILTGISPTGMNASSEGEMRSFYDWISSQQEAHWRYPLDVCIKLIMLDLWGEIDDTITWDFDPLWQPSDKELAEIRTANANADGVYIDRGVLSQEESRKRLANDKSSGYAGIDVSDVPEQPIEADPFGGEPFGNSEELPAEAEDKSVSEAQHKAMAAAAGGHSTLGIPKKVGKEFIAKDEFKESEHPRDEYGKFSSGGASSIGGAKTQLGGSAEFKSWYKGPTDSDGSPVVFVHNSQGQEINEIKDSGRFGAIFALQDKASGYGDKENYFVSNQEPKTSSDLQDYVDSLEDGGKEIAEKFLRKDLTDEEAERAIEIAIEQESSDDEEDLDLMRAVDASDMYKEMQGLRIALAKASGAGVVEMEDEFGTSYALLNSPDVKSVNSFK